LNIVVPVSPSRTKIQFHSYVWKEEKLNIGAGASLDKVELEDEEVVEHVQKGIRSRFYEHGRYSVTKETGTHHFHRLISEFMG
jgi:choline monooxygenase